MRMQLGLVAWFLVIAVAVFPAAAQQEDAEAPPAKAVAAPEVAPAAEPEAAPAAESEAAPAAESEAAPAAEPEGEASSSTSAEFQQILDEFRKTVGELRILQERYREAAESDQADLEKQWEELIAQGRSLKPRLLAAAEKAFVAEPEANRGAGDLLASQVLSKLTARDDQAQQRMKPHELTDDFFEAWRLSKLLLENGYESDVLYDAAGVSAFAMNEFEAAEEYLKLANKKQRMTSLGRQYLAGAKVCQRKWAAEQKIRQAEAEADDLPRVKLTTSKGDIVLELFENEAPNTVANFISLVDKGFYDGLTFHRVLPAFMAQGGCPRGDGMGDPGYKIPCECHKPGYRRHFGGSLSMAKAAAPDTGGSQFFLTFTPTSFLDGQHTVFGRVHEGLDVLFKIQRRDPAGEAAPEPDKILKAEVLRRRDHEYVPKKVGDEFDS